MKTQMRFQKILCLVSLIVSAITIVYGFAFFTGGLATVADIYDHEYDMFHAEGVYNFAQTVNDVLVILGIVFLCVVAVMYITACQKRRNYYITNYIVSIGAAAFMAAFAIAGIALVAATQAMFISDVDWEAFREFNAGLTDPLFQHNGESQVMFYIGYIVYIIVILNALAVVYNLIWKIKLMKGEKALLEAGLSKEVA